MHMDFVCLSMLHKHVYMLDCLRNGWENIHWSYWEENDGIVVGCEKHIHGKKLKGSWWRAIFFKSIFCWILEVCGGGGEC